MNRSAARTRALLWAHRRETGASALMELWSAAAATGLAALMADLMGSRTDGFSAGALLVLLLVSLMVFVRHFSARARLRLEHAIARDLQRRAIDRLLDKKLDRQTEGAGALVQELLADSARAASAAAGLPALVLGGPAATAALAAFLVSRGGAALALLALTLVPLAAALTWSLGRMLARRAEKRSRSEAALSGAAVELGRGIELLQAAEGSGKVYEIVAARAREIERRSERIQELGSLAAGLSEGLKTGIFLLAVWLLSREGLASAESLGLLPAAYFLYGAVTQMLAGGANSYAGLSLLSRLAEEPSGSLSGAFPPAGFSSAPVISIDRLTYGYPGGRELIRDLSLEIPPGAWLAVTGPSGSGKTTLIRALLGSLTIPDGTIRLGGFNLNRIPAFERRRLFFLLTQEPLVLGFTLRENFQLASPGVSEAAIRQAVERMGLSRRVDETGLDVEIRPSHFSGGEKQRLSLARLLVSEAPVAVLDEPGVFLDPANELEVIELLAETAGRRTLVTVTHNPRILRRADFVLELGPSGHRLYRNDRSLANVTPLRPA